MRTRLLGSAVVVLAILGGLNLVHALRRDRGHDRPTTAGTVAFAGDRRTDRVMIDESFQVREGQRILVDVQHADLVVETAPGLQARIVVTVTSDDMPRAVERFEKMRFSAGLDASGPTLTSKPEDGGFFRGSWNTVRMDIRVRLVIPREFDLDLTSSHGDVSLASHRGTARISTTHGDVDADALEGASITIETTHGDLHASILNAPTVTLGTTHGDIELGTVTGDVLLARTTHSDVSIEGLSARADVETTHGDVAMSVLATTGLRVETTHGDVSIELPKHLAVDVDLEGDPVLLDTDGAFDGNRDEERIVGSINGGGSRIDVSTTFGSVRVRG